MKLSPAYNLKKCFPEIATEWHTEENGILTPNAVLPFSNKKVWWKCKSGHSWEAIIANRSKGATQCPYCTGVAAHEKNNFTLTHHHLLQEWDFAKNINISPEKITHASTKTAWWKCKAGHEWASRIDHRTTGSNCPFCSGRYATSTNCLLIKNPFIAKEWHPTKNGKLTPSNVTANASKAVWWKCEKGHEWQSKIFVRNAGYKCPYCSNKKACKDNCLATVQPELSTRWHKKKNGYLTPNDVLPGSGKKVWWICDNEHEWFASIKHRTAGRGCPICYKLRIGIKTRIRKLIEKTEYEKEVQASLNK